MQYKLLTSYFVYMKEREKMYIKKTILRYYFQR